MLRMRRPVNLDGFRLAVSFSIVQIALKVTPIIFFLSVIADVVGVEDDFFCKIIFLVLIASEDREFSLWTDGLITMRYKKQFCREMVSGSGSVSKTNSNLLLTCKRCPVEFSCYVYIFSVLRCGYVGYVTNAFTSLTSKYF